jgi:hypothetical protein
LTDSSLQAVAKAAMIALMAFFSVMLWLGIPIVWLWIGSQVQSDSQSTGFGPYFLVIFGICISVFLVTKLLAWLNRRYARVSGADDVVRVRPPWYRSMRGEEDSRPPRSVLDVVMVISVSIAVTAMTIWFFFFAGSSLPT